MKTVGAEHRIVFRLPGGVSTCFFLDSAGHLSLEEMCSACLRIFEWTKAAVSWKSVLACPQCERPSTALNRGVSLCGIALEQGMLDPLDLAIIEKRTREQFEQHRVNPLMATLALTAFILDLEEARRVLKGEKRWEEAVFSGDHVFRVKSQDER